MCNFAACNEKYSVVALIYIWDNYKKDTNIIVSRRSL